MIINETETSIVSTNESSSLVTKSEIHNSKLIIDYLRNKMYNNKIQTPIQEYISNAIDAMTKAGKSETPVKIVLPTGLKKEIKIRDFGIGLTNEDMKSIFMQYGNSNKVGSLDMVGGYGLGSKSGWAYSPVFFVSNYFNSKKTVYIARINDEGDGEFVQSAEVETTEPNGIEITIPVQENDIRQFINATIRGSLFRKTRPDIVGEESLYNELSKELDSPVFKFKHLKAKVVKKTNKFSEVMNFQFHTNIVVVVDGVPYAFTDDKFPLTNNYCLVLEFDSSEVQVQTDRERLSESGSTHENIKNRLKMVYNELRKTRIRTRNNISSLKELYNKSIIDREVFVEKGIVTGKNRYGGDVVSKLPSMVYLGSNFSAQVRTDSYYGKHETVVILNSTIVDNKVIIGGKKFDNIVEYTIQRQALSEVNPTRGNLKIQLGKEEENLFFSGSVLVVDEETTEYQMKRKIKKFLTDNKSIGRIFLVSKELSEFIGFETPKVYKLSSMPLPKTVKKPKREGLGINVYVNNRWGNVTRELKELDLDNLGTNKYMYFKTVGNKLPEWYSDMDSYDRQRLISFLNDEGYTLVSITSSTEEKILDKDNFKNFDSYIEEFDLSFATIALTLEHVSFPKLVQRIKGDFLDVSPEFNDFINLLNNVKDKKLPNILLRKVKMSNDLYEYLSEMREFVCKNFAIIREFSYSDSKDSDFVEDLSDYVMNKLKNKNMTLPERSENVLETIKKYI